MTDSYSGHQPQEGYEEIPFFPPYGGEQRERDHIDGWRVTQEIQPGRFSLNDFDFKKPRAGLIAAVNAPEHKSDQEVYDYPGEYENASDGETYNRMRMEQAATQYEVCEGTGNARGLVVGAHFTLKDFPRTDQNREYLVTNATFSLDTGEFESTHRTGPKVTYRVSFQALETNTPFRPARETPRPEIAGPQTAIVTGGKGDEIYTDQFGRIKVKFHWDRAAEKNENSSCWLRVSQAWAGADWGAIHIPRVGQEVIVEFLEGDPDRPIVTGRVYNANSMPPYQLPANKTQSGIKSRSTKGGGASNFNELRFEDKKGEEQVYMQAEKNMDTLVKADQTLTVGANRTKAIGKDESTTIGQNRTELVTLNEKIEIGGNRSETVQGTETLNIVGPRTETLLATETITIAGTRTETVGGAETITIGAARTTTIAGADTLIIGGGLTMAVTGAGKMEISGAMASAIGGGSTTAVLGSESTNVGKDSSLNVVGKRSQNIGKDDALDVGKKLVINAGDEITIKAGSASITLKKNGDITIKGKNIALQGSGKITTKASGQVTVKGSNIGNN
jgi:type VI secretion system secreted protein VgrG